MKKIVKSRNFYSGMMNAVIVLGIMFTCAYTATQARAQNIMAQLQAEERLQIQQQLANYEIAEAEYQRQLECLSKNIYFEARSEGALGQRAVAWVTLNRVESERFPDTICEVVHQARRDASGNPLRHQCQFSWYCDGKSDRIANQEKYQEAIRMAELVLARYGVHPDPTEGAVMYHAVYVNPYWTDSFVRTTQIDTHIFYSENGA